MFDEIFRNLRDQKPLIHSITNYVTANDCANMLLACGASAIMADDAQEVEEIIAACQGLCLNMGTPSARRLEAMVLAGRRANALGHPVVLDPVGVGASRLRREGARQLLGQVRFAVIRGNLSEVKTLATGCLDGHGVDAADRVTVENQREIIGFAKTLAQSTGAVIAVTGETDIVADSQRAYCIHNGHPMMARVTGTGCQLSVLTAAFVTANPAHPLEAAAAAAAAMGLAGEIAYSRLSPMDGNAGYRNGMIDAMFRLTPEDLERGARYEVR